MSKIIFRLAKPSDAKQIATIHWSVRERYSDGIFLSLGRSFLKKYYSIILNDPYEVIVCAENENGKVLGFSSATQNVEKQSNNLRKHIFSLGFSAMFSLIKHPSLIKEIWIRYKSIRGDKDAPRFIGSTGCRGEYWCWLKDGEGSMLSSKVDTIRNMVLADLGEKYMLGEVDKKNESVLKYQCGVNDAEVIDEIVLPDGRERVIFRMELINNKKKMANK